MSGRGQHWAEIGESTSVGGILLLCAVHRWLGRWPFRLCVYPVVLVHWLLNGTARRATLQYLRRAHEHLGVPARRPGMWQSLHHFAMFAETMLDKILALGQRYPVDKVTMERQGVLARVKAGEGGLLVTAHLGCLELCQVMADQVPGFRLTALVHTAAASNLGQMLVKICAKDDIPLVNIVRSDAQVAILKAIGATHIVNSSADDFVEQLTAALVEHPDVELVLLLVHLQ